MKHCLKVKHQAEMKDWSFSRDRKFVKVNRCRVADADGNLLDVSEWPVKISAHLQKIFNAPHEETAWLQRWIDRTTHECVKSGHNFSAEQISEGA
eukprot:6809927-Karenia_brevis.AAC.1